MWPFGKESKSLSKQPGKESQANWKVLEEEDHLNDIIATSQKKPVVIFKHSTSCSISAMAKHRLKSKWDFTSKEAAFYYLDLLKYRPLSNKVATTFQVVHQSPQVLVIVNGQSVFDASHSQVSVSALEPFIKKP